MEPERNDGEQDRLTAVRGFQKELLFRALIGASTLGAGLMVHGFGWVPMPLLPLTTACFFVMLVNVPYYFFLEKSSRPERLVTLFLTADVGVISLLIHATGGINVSVLILGYPLVIIYAAVTLSARDTFVLAFCSMLSYFCLFLLEGVSNRGTMGADYSFSWGYASARAGAAICLLAIMAWFSSSFSRKLKRTNRQLARARSEVELRTQELVQSEKTGALGRLAAAMAHEINKPNFVIRNLAEILIEDRSLDENTREESLAAILRQSANIEGSVGRLLSFAKPQAHDRRWVDLNELLGEALNTLRKISSAGVVFRTDLQPGLPEVFADRIQLQQLLRNLLINAVQSLGGQGRILIRSRTLSGKELEPDGGAEAREVQEEEKILITVSDTGPGIPLDQLDRVFEPYFTTKPEGEGYGLGLAICQEIVAAHGGSIHVESRQGEGSRFSITLPLKQK
jgi:signal transduction histidine kinase